MIIGDVSEPAKAASTRLRDGLLDLLANDLVAIWLYGGQLDRLGSPGDVDLHCIVRSELTESQLVCVRTLHEEIRDELRIDELDAWYVLVGEARSGDRPRDLNWPTLIRDENWALKRAHWFAGAYVLVYGTSPETIVPRPRWPEVEAELLAQVERADTSDHPHPAGLTLRLCRVLLTLDTRDVVHFKVDGAVWAQSLVSPVSRDHVAAAIRIYRGEASAGDADLVKQRMRAFYEELRSLVEAKTHA